VFASSKNTCYLCGRHPCFSHRSHLGHLAPGGLKVEAVSEAFLSETLVVSPLMASGEMALFLLQNISGRRAGAKRGFVMFLVMHIFLQQAFSSPNVSGLLPFGSN